MFSFPIIAVAIFGNDHLVNQTFGDRLYGYRPTKRYNMTDKGFIHFRFPIADLLKAFFNRMCYML